MQHVSVALPCKPGETLYIRHGTQIDPKIVSRFVITEGMEIAIYLKDSHRYYTGKDIGQSVFGSEKEAKGYLASKKNNHFIT